MGSRLTAGRGGAALESLPLQLGILTRGRFLKVSEDKMLLVTAFQFRAFHLPFPRGCGRV